MNIRPAFAQIELGAVRHNARQYLSCLPRDSFLMAVVKADGYGHGAYECLKAAIQEGVSWAGVALVEEAMELRDRGIEIPILLLSGIFPKMLGLLFEYRITPTVYSLEVARLIQEEAKRRGRLIEVHLKVETGMGRLGLNREQFRSFLAERDQSFSHLKVEGIMTHFAKADERDKSFTELQLERFSGFVEEAREAFELKWIHTANSAGTSEIDLERGNLFRVGIGLYGQQPSTELIRPLDLREAITLKSQIIQIQDFEAGSPISYGGTFVTERPSKIATIAMGYADGYPRLLSNQGRVLVKGRPAPIVGRVCMDMTLIDVTDLEGVALFDEVVLIGQSGEHRITATELAEITGTINYEITCDLTKRIPRFYQE